MKAILVIDIPDDYQKYGSGDWYVAGDILRIGYKEKNGSFIGKIPIENRMVQLKPMPTDKIGAYSNSFAEDYISFTEGWDCYEKVLMGDTK